MTSGRAPARPPARGALALGLALSVATGGCSFMWMHPPPHREDWPNPVQADSSEARCTTSLGPPVLDTLSFSILGTLAFVERNAITYEPGPNVDSMGNLRPARAGASHFAPPNNTLNPVPDYLARGIAGAFAVGALTAAVSAVYGYVNNARCKRYHALFHPPLD